VKSKKVEDEIGKVGTGRGREIAGSRNVEVDGSGLRLLDVARGMLAEGAGRSRDIEYGIDAISRIGRIRKSRKVKKGRRDAKSLRNVKNVECRRRQRRRRRSGRQPLKTSIPDRHSETLYQKYLENRECDGWAKLRDCRAEMANTKYT
jgi:hypothetical protein